MLQHVYFNGSALPGSGDEVINYAQGESLL